MMASTAPTGSARLNHHCGIPIDGVARPLSRWETTWSQPYTAITSRNSTITTAITIVTASRSRPRARSCRSENPR
jgi:hypothetical protein